MEYVVQSIAVLSLRHCLMLRFIFTASYLCKALSTSKSGTKSCGIFANIWLYLKPFGLYIDDLLVNISSKIEYV